MIADQREQALAIRRPDGLVEAAEEIRRQFGRARSVGIHHIEIVLLVGEHLVVIAAIGDALAVRRDDGGIVRPVAGRQGTDGQVRQFQRVNLALDRIHLAVFGQVAGDEQRIIVQPGRALHRRLAGRHLTRRAAVHRQHEHLVGAVGQVARAIGAEGDVVEHLHRIAPGRALRLFRRRCETRVLGGHQHREGDGLAVRRPDRFGGPLQELREGKAAAGVEIQHPDFRARGIHRRVDEARAIRRPARRRGGGAGDQRAMLAAGDVNRPQLPHIAVGEPVHGMAHIDDGLAVRRNLRISGILDVEHAVRREALGLRLGRFGENGLGGKDSGQRRQGQGAGDHVALHQQCLAKGLTCGETRR